MDAIKELSLANVGTISALCEPENQPHQWVSDPGKLLADLFGCKEDAEWVIYDQDPYAEAYTCSTHLPEMVSETSVEIRRADTGSQCCFIVYFEAGEAAERVAKWHETAKGRKV